MRIAYVINSVEGGGAAAPVPAIASVLKEGGAEVKVFALTGRDRRGLPAMLAAGLPVAVRDGSDGDHVAALRWLDRTLCGWRPDVVWTSLTRATLLGQLVARRHRWPVVSWQHAAFLRPWNLRLLRWSRSRSQLWIGDSESVTALTAERLKVPPARLATWPIFRADPRQPTAVSWRPGEPVRIGSLGRLHPVKGYDMLLAALAQLPAGLPAWHLTIAGEGGQRDALLGQATGVLRDRVSLPGFTTDPVAFLATCHLYLQPSRSEGMCIAAHEAMAAGVPVVASAVGEMPHSIIDGVTGRLVAPNDAGLLAAAITDVLRFPETLATAGAAARARVLDRFGPDRFRATGLAILDRVRALAKG